MDTNIRVLIIDDEEMARTGINKHVRWKEFGISMTFLADGYQQALQIMEKEKIDIVISDVRMPRMNGIELCNELQKRNPDVKIIFISGFSDKEYLKGAIRLSAIEYLEKPINIQELEECIEKAVGICQSRQKALQREKETKQLISTSEQIIKEQYMWELLHGKNGEGLYEQLPRRIKERIALRLFCGCVIVKFLHRNLPNSFDISEEKRNLENQLGDTVLFASSREGQYVVLCLCVESEEKWNKEIEWKLYLYQKAKADNRIMLYITKSSLGKGIDCFVSQYQQTFLSMQSYCFYGILPKDSFERQSGRSLEENIRELYLKFCKAMSLQNKDEAESLVREVYQKYREDANELPDVVKNQFFNFHYYIYQDACRNKLDIGDQQNIGKEFLWSKIDGLETLKECYDCLLEEIHEYFENLGHMVSDNRSILQAIEYIKKNFQDEDLSIKDISDKVYLSSSYLSALFKQKTGKTVGQYIREERMNYAALLLEDRSRVISDIAKECGYVDAKYFAKVFKSQYKVLPSEYREKVLCAKEK